MLAPPRGFSQLAASFVGYQHQGIPRVPFLPFPRFSPSSFPYSPVNVHEQTYKMERRADWFSAYFAAEELSLFSLERR